MDGELELLGLFSDVEPLPQDDGPEPVVRIAYSQAFTAVMDIFRRVLVTGEHSERTLRLSGEVIRKNAANYTAWQYRRNCIAKIHANSSEQVRIDAWRAELDTCGEMCLRNPKNYQVWFHRRCCVEILQESSHELEFVAQVLDEDSKNYHAWGHRQWVLKEFQLWDQELDYIETLLDQDLRNNSAWNQRYFVMQHTADLKNVDFVRSEVALAFKYIARAPSNPSPWNYIRGLLEPIGFDALPEVRARCEELGVIVTHPSSDSLHGDDPSGGKSSMQVEVAAVNKRHESDATKANTTSSDIAPSQALDAYDNASTGIVSEGIRSCSGEAGESGGNFPAEDSGSSVLHNEGGKSEHTPCLHALSLLIEILQASALEQQRQDDLQLAAKLCLQLAQLDPIRVRFWQW
eukprot:CAMPEP_0119335510 /NCGR_PEP_ID=MMETSP1333-20130426/89742_1 /TAXON_ID=418940 /ORGANISM="Scyphosphaera apsteinii, Strain RCC1455" /LENGTH=403 /DNA_ID=CAMNT_0007346073 /DNA_START=65 /DNA_END=1273 /DNA_ORIENTATION=-